MVGSVGGEMKLSSSLAYCKKISCPSANHIVQYLCQELSATESERVQTHVRSCDFCGGELQLLAQHPAETEECITPMIPKHLHLLAEALLTGRVATDETFAELTYQIGA